MLLYYFVEHVFNRLVLRAVLSYCIMK